MASTTTSKVRAGERLRRMSRFRRSPLPEGQYGPRTQTYNPTETIKTNVRNDATSWTPSIRLERRLNTRLANSNLRANFCIVLWLCRSWLTHIGPASNPRIFIGSRNDLTLDLDQAEKAYAMYFRSESRSASPMIPESQPVAFHA